MGGSRGWYKVGLLAGAMSLIAAACGSASSGAAASGSSTAQVPANYASYALHTGDTYSWVLPIPNEANYEPWDQNAEYGMYRPLYVAGSGASPVVNYANSIAQKPVYSNGNKTVTVTLNPWKWSDGSAVTARDVQFFYNLYVANKSQIATYVPGNFPDNVAKFTVDSPTQFTLTLKSAVNPLWFTDNELTDVVPLPQQSWDRTSLSGKVGNYDLTTSGAKAVFKFLYAQSSKLATYATNPLWKVVDGPWKLQSYDPTTARTVFARNKAFTGPDKPKLSGYVLESFSSQTAEVDALRNGSLDYGYLPLSDVKLASTFKAGGYTIAPWATDYVQWAELGYTSKTWGPLVKQLYIRQALQHLINEPLYLSATLHGDGQLTYGPVPNLPGSPYVSAQEKRDPYPYSVSSAKALLAAHGWSAGSGGVLICSNPGTGASQCGAGISKNEPLSLKFMYQTGTPTLQAQVEAFATAAKSAGVDLVLDPQSQSTMFSVGGVCPSSGPCNWGIILYRTFLWNYGQGDVLPTGGQMFGSGNYWGGGYSSAKAQSLINATHTQAGLQPLFNYENYISSHVAALWFPTWDWQVSVVSNHLHGWNPQQVFGNPVPSRWYF
ncbi:ABC transporter substrate-binding protein [Ferrimicrobium acidiphilum]|uniref:Bacterial extracellular solute-binding protein n=2 Tax=Ferrimicrobium acidiphilum TaxID=121039 RepID=A0A0D8FX36_9ACTN|nr:ABC transporter substrate-binding protein [Ferrimicrobium acidiphilum]KJE77833.1 bacterial extracellular solute-binding protein [Ferrimicrobium acidiphilum DSM 19497]MCL5052995.1 ABC transporter substrate-binding protein [Gammaproteobacteria bacterium]